MAKTKFLIANRSFPIDVGKFLKTEVYFKESRACYFSIDVMFMVVV